MKTSAQPSAYIAIVTVCALLFQFGACSYSGKPQSIPVTSNPAGARIIVDGQDAGTTPLSLSLTRRDSHRIRIEKPGFTPVEIVLTRKTSTPSPAASIGMGLIVIPISTAAGVCLGYAIGGDDEMGHMRSTPMVIGGLVGLIGSTVLILALSANSDKSWLTPSTINVMLEKAQPSARAETRTNVVVLDGDQLKDLRWIRISCAEGGEAGVVAVNQ